MKAFLEDEQTDAPPNPGDQETSDEDLAYRIRLCFTFAALAESLDDFVTLYNGEVTGAPPRLNVGQGLIWEFEERPADDTTDDQMLYIRRVQDVPAHEGDIT